MGFIPKQTKLWKVHGSLGWHYDNEAGKIFRKESNSEDILIYPSTLKYSESRKQPYTALMDRLTAFLKQSDTILITCGYSFSDEHINERITTALNNPDSGHVIALFYDIKMNNEKKEYLLEVDSDLSSLAKSTKKLSVYGCRNAVIGGVFGEWVLKSEPDKEEAINTYFVEDESTDSNKGELILPDFSKFVSFLQAMILKDDLLGESR